MTKIVKKASAGTLESSDALVEIVPAADFSLELSSLVMERFGKAIEKTARDELSRLGVEKAAVRISDRGALDCVLRARIEAAVLRAKEEEL